MHVKDMVELGRKHPGVLAEFRKGHLLVQKSERKFSLIPKDHSHEQTTKTLKGASGVANIFDRPDTMHVPEKLQVLADFEAAADIVTGATSSMFHGHHEEGHSLQTRFANDVTSLLSVLRNKGNPFLSSNGPDLVTFDTRQVMDADSAKLFCSAYTKGKTLHETFVLARLRNGSVSITDTITRVSLPTFAKRPQHKSKDNKVYSLKRDDYLVSHLFLSLQSRPDFDLDDFFSTLRIRRNRLPCQIRGC